jgi:hypothetical protein
MNVEENQEAHNEEAAVDTIRTQEDRYGDRHLAVGHRWQPKKWTQGGGGSQQKMTVASRGMTFHAIQALHKGHCCQGQGYTKYLERTDGRQDMMEGLGMQQWHKEPRCNPAATSEEGEDNRQRHQGTKHKTSAVTGKQGKC